MFWQSIMAGRWIDLATLHRAVSDTFALAPGLIDVVDDIGELTGPVPPDPRILVERTRREGDFPLQFDVFVGGDEIERPIANLAGTLVRARALAHRLNTNLLLGTGPIGHYEHLRVTPDGAVDVVELDADELDEERFVIIGARPFTEQPAESAPARAS
jgi:hypothetical protein